MTFSIPFHVIHFQSNCEKSCIITRLHFLIHGFAVSSKFGESSFEGHFPTIVELLYCTLIDSFHFIGPRAWTELGITLPPSNLSQLEFMWERDFSLSKGYLAFMGSGRERNCSLRLNMNCNSFKKSANPVDG